MKWKKLTDRHGFFDPITLLVICALIAGAYWYYTEYEASPAGNPQIADIYHRLDQLEKRIKAVEGRQGF